MWLNSKNPAVSTGLEYQLATIGDASIAKFHATPTFLHEIRPKNKQTIPSVSATTIMISILL
ncbi:MAG: hypothetical protein RL316_942 [Bacteroidota bacterium]|jgi:hypothetical protein